jgi:hypothetical protein
MGLFLFTTASRTSLEPTQPPIQWVPGTLSLGVKRPGREADHYSTNGRLQSVRVIRRPFAKFVDSLLLRVGTLWKCGDGLFLGVPPLTSDAHLATLHPLLWNVLHTVDHLEISCLGAPFSWLEKPRNRMARDLNWILCSALKSGSVEPH